MNNRPTGIIRTLPTLEKGSTGYRKYVAAIRRLEQGGDDPIYIALSQMPRHDILHIYLLIGGKVRVRLNVAGYEDGDSRECWDTTVRKPKYWVVCTGPVSRPPEPVLMRGFQGF